jgi:heme A synthase
MTLLRRLSYTALAVAFLHVVFGAVVRISGSGMGCGDHWPKCYGSWFPPFDRPDLVIEVLHRYFAAALTTVVVALLAAAVLRRRAAGVGGRGGVLRASALSVALVLFAAGFGAVTVFLANPAWATAVHKVIAAALLATLAAATIRAGGLGGARVGLGTGRPRVGEPGGEPAAGGRASSKSARGATAAAALALAAVLLGALTAKLPDAAVACQGFPLCGEGSLGGGAQHVQLTHRVVAYLLSFHLLGLLVAVSKRREPAVVTAASRVAFGIVLLQLALGASMVLSGLPAVLRSLHQATGVLLWLTTFVFAYLARAAARGWPSASTELSPTVGRGRPVAAEARP